MKKNLIKMVEEKSPGFQILEILYKNRFDPGCIHFNLKKKVHWIESAKKLDKLGYIRYEREISEISNRTIGMFAAILTDGIEYFEKLKESKTKSLQTWMIVIFTAIIACMTIINIALTAINIWLNFKN